MPICFATYSQFRFGSGGLGNSLGVLNDYVDDDDDNNNNINNDCLFI